MIRALVGFSLLCVIYYYNRKVLVCYVYSFYNPCSYGELSLYVFFMLSLDTPAEVYKLILYFDLQEIHHFIILLCNHHKNLVVSQIITTKVCLSRKFRINYFVIFSKGIFCFKRVNILPSNSFDRPDVANIEIFPQT